MRPPPGPVSDRWAIGVGDALAGLTRAPEPLRDIMRALNRFGGLAISGQSVEFDGDAVDWSDVDDIETLSLIGYLLTGAIANQVNKLPVPWFPGRALVLGVVSEAALTVLVATAGGVLHAVDVPIPAEVNYRGMVRRRTLTPGILATLLLAHPAVRTTLVATAQAHGVAVRPADDDPMEDAEQRAERIKALLAKLTDR